MAKPFSPEAPKFARQVNAGVQGYDKFSRGPKLGKAPKPAPVKLPKRSGRGS